MVELELVGLPGRDLARDATRRLRFDIHATVKLHSMVLHGLCVVVACFRSVAFYLRLSYHAIRDLIFFADLLEVDLSVIISTKFKSEYLKLDTSDVLMATREVSVHLCYTICF